MDNVANFFGEKFRSQQARIESYDFIERFIDKAHPDWAVTPATGIIVDNFLAELKKLSEEELSFLVVHSGYIPEHYKADSSAETLYSKLIEATVKEWAVRIGFTDSRLPTQKSSMEDVSILDAQHVIVCDAKSFRLGRSQGAPNVKDVLKHADIAKWLSAHTGKTKLGGLIAFPSEHDWKSGSDFYQYTTDKTSPTVCLYYEHLAFFLVSGMASGDLVDLFKAYHYVFPLKLSKSQNNRETYYREIEGKLLRDREALWKQFLPSAKKIIAEKVYHCAHTLRNYISLTHRQIEEKYLTETDIEVLRKRVIEAEFAQATSSIAKQIKRIGKFRTSAAGYYEE